MPGATLGHAAPKAGFSSSGPAETTPRRLEAAVIAGAVVLYAVFIARTAFRVDGELFFSLFDDAMISMRYAANLADGHGLRWNVGEAPVEGYSNLLWTLWMAALHWLGPPSSKISLLVMVSGGALLVGNLLVVRNLARRLAPAAPAAPLVALLLCATYYPLAYWTLRGMEVGLLALVTSSFALQALRVRDRASTRRLAVLAGLMAVGVLTRDDVLVPCLLVGGFVLIVIERSRRPAAALLLGGGVFAAVGAHEALRYVYYGDLLPNTYYLKVADAGLEVRLRRGATALLDVLAAGLYLPLALAAAGTLRAGAPRSEAALLWTLFTAQCAYSAYVGGDAWEWMRASNRYVTAAVPLLLVLAAVGCVTLAHEAQARATALLGCVALLLAVVLVDIEWTSDLAVSPLFDRVDHTSVRLRLAEVGIAVFLALWAAARMRTAVPPAMATGLMVLAAVLAVNFMPVREWLRSNATHFEDDAAMTRYGLALRRVTRPDATIAVVWAGALPYFAERRTVDLLGKSDRVVARGPHAAPFFPGHSKFDYAHSVGQLRPDVVAQTWMRHPGEPLAEFRSSGYVPLLGSGVLPRSTPLERLGACEGLVLSSARLRRPPGRELPPRDMAVERKRLACAPVIRWHPAG